MRWFCLLMSANVVLWWSLSNWPRACSIPGQKPNILFLMTDDQGPWALGLSGQSLARTPHLDRLFREGAYFVNAFCPTPVCSPSRAAILTSRYGSEVGITDWIHPKKEPDVGLSTEFLTWPRLLRQAGYATGLIGKWHLGTQPRFHPQQHGFDYFFGFLEGSSAPYDPILEENGQPVKCTGYHSDLLTDKALEFLSKHRERPFALCVHYREPHAPYTPQPKADAAVFRQLEIRPPDPGIPNLNTALVVRAMRDYLGCVHAVDRNVGRILEHLDRLRLTEKTLVIFTSDNGYNIGHHGIWHKGNGTWMVSKRPPGTADIPANCRPNMFDTSLKVPTAMRWPSRIRPGQRISHTITHLDWFPTICAAAQVAIPPNTLIRGRSLFELLDGNARQWNNDYYGEYSLHLDARAHLRCYRTPRWKLVRDFLHPERDEFYDLTKDPDEKHNLIHDQSPEVRQAVQTLDAHLISRMRQLRDPILKLTR
ncbi:Arylsulfatase [bacterium HR36]|nr:Arylsulfatase [bacterium HR36]